MFHPIILFLGRTHLLLSRLQVFKMMHGRDRPSSVLLPLSLELKFLKCHNYFYCIGRVLFVSVHLYCMRNEHTAVRPRREQQPLLLRGHKTMKARKHVRPRPTTTDRIVNRKEMESWVHLTAPSVVLLSPLSGLKCSRPLPFLLAAL